MKMEETECSETSKYEIQTPGNYPKKDSKYRTKRKLEIKNMGLHNVRTHYMHHIHIKNWPEDGSFEPKHVAILYIIEYILICLME
jgi:hypothetical protein